MSLISRIKKVCAYFLSGIIVLLFIVWGASFIILPWQVNKQLAPMNLSLNSEASLSFNPFTLNIQVDDFSILDKASVNQLTLQHAHFNLSWLNLISQQIVIEKAAIESLHVNITRNNDKLIIAGVDLSANESSNNNLDTKTIINEEKNNEDPLSSIQGWRLMMPSFLFNDIALNINDQGKSQKIVLNSFSINELNASLEGVSVNVALDAAINAASLKVTSNINATLYSNELITASIQNQLAIKKLDIRDWQYLLPLEENQVSKISGLVNFSTNQEIKLENKQWKIKQPSLRLALQDINVVKPELELLNESFIFELNKLSVNGAEASLIDASGEAQLMVDNVNITTNNEQLAALSTLAINTIEFSVNDKLSAVANIPNITLKDILFSKPNNVEDALYSNKELLINNVTWLENHLGIDSINLGEFNTNVVLSAKKELKNLVTIEQVKSSTDIEDKKDKIEVVDKQETNTESAVTFSLNQFKLTSPSNITFTDESVTPIFIQDIALSKMMVNKVDSRDKTYMSSFNIAMALGEHATNTIDGTIAPFNDKMNMTLAVKLSELSMPPLSSYLRTALGFDFLSGQLDNKINLTIKEDEMSGETIIDLRGFELASGNDTTDLSASTGGAMGLNSALNMLKDSQGNVSLSVPLSGNINDPSFGVSNILTLVAKKAVMSQAKSYLINTFVPYANVITVASIAGEYLLRVEMNDLVYTAGQVTLNEDQQQFSNELAALLKDKPKQQVKMCSIASIDEASTLSNVNTEEQKITLLKGISKDRGDNLKNILIKTHGINSSRLLLCAPRVENEKGALPRVEFSF